MTAAVHIPVAGAAERLPAPRRSLLEGQRVRAALAAGLRIGIVGPAMADKSASALALCDAAGLTPVVWKSGVTVDLPAGSCLIVDPVSLHAGDALTSQLAAIRGRVPALLVDRDEKTVRSLLTASGGTSDVLLRLRTPDADAVAEHIAVLLAAVPHRLTAAERNAVAQQLGGLSHAVINQIVVDAMLGALQSERPVDAAALQHAYEAWHAIEGGR